MSCDEVQWLPILTQAALVVAFLYMAKAFGLVIRLNTATHKRINAIATLLDMEPKIEELERRASILVDKGFGKP